MLTQSQEAEPPLMSGEMVRRREVRSSCIAILEDTLNRQCGLNFMENKWVTAEFIDGHVNRVRVKYWDIILPIVGERLAVDFRTAADPFRDLSAWESEMAASLKSAVAQLRQQRRLIRQRYRRKLMLNQKE
jgi:hypothetical protein